jgi:LysR family transcriptional regulator, glycine cleavage system transcriptional activator
MVALQAAEDNQGVTLGWHSQVESLIQSGRLVRLGDMQISAPGSYYLVWDENRPLSDAARQLREWLLLTGKQTTLSV